MNWTLYRKECRSSCKSLLLFAAIVSLYISVIVSMYDPEMALALRQFADIMPEIMAAVGMVGNQDTLMGFLIVYLYGMILLIFPMVSTILRANALMARYVDQGSMAALLAAPISRTRVAFTQLMVLLTGIVAFIAFCTGLEWGLCQALFPGELELQQLLWVNGGLLCLHLFLGGLCFFFSCLFSQSRHALAFGAGIPVLMYVLQMLANLGGKLEKLKYATFFTLFQPQDLALQDPQARLFVAGLLLAGLVLGLLGIWVFRSKDLHI